MKHRTKIERILKFVCNYYDISEKAMSREFRDKEIVKARQMYCFLSYQFAGGTMSSIGKLINRDHTTVVYAVNKIKVQKEIYSDLKKELDEIINSLYGYFPLIPTNVNLLHISENNTPIEP
jgi:chromosomal replication initiator protein